MMTCKAPKHNHHDHYFDTPVLGSCVMIPWLRWGVFFNPRLGRVVGITKTGVGRRKVYHVRLYESDDEVWPTGPVVGMNNVQPHRYRVSFQPDGGK